MLQAARPLLNMIIILGLFETGNSHYPRTNDGFARALVNDPASDANREACVNLAAEENIGKEKRGDKRDDYQTANGDSADPDHRPTVPKSQCATRDPEPPGCYAV